MTYEQAVSALRITLPNMPSRGRQNMAICTIAKENNLDYYALSEGLKDILLEYTPEELTRRLGRKLRKDWDASCVFRDRGLALLVLAVAQQNGMDYRDLAHAAGLDAYLFSDGCEVMQYARSICECMGGASTEPDEYLPPDEPEVPARFPDSPSVAQESPRSTFEDSEVARARSESLTSVKSSNRKYKRKQQRNSGVL
jgi:hypothetical protein